MTDDGLGGRTQAGGSPLAVEIGANRRVRLGIAMFLAGPVIWSAHFMVVYLVTEAGCTAEGSGLSAFDPPVPTIVTLATTVVAVVASFAVARWCYRQWRGVRGDAGDDGGSQGQGGERADAVLPFAGFLMALLGVVNVLLVGLPALVLPAC